MSKLTHINERGEAHMVDVGGKETTNRVACAEAQVRVSADTMELLTLGGHTKGDVFAAVRIAGIQAAKKCSELIPLCHPLMLTKIEVNVEADEQEGIVSIRTLCQVSGQTGVEMEALTAASVAALTLYDMCKATDRGMTIEQIRLLEKSGGKSGNWVAAADK